MNLAEYGADWPQFSKRIRFDRAAGRCECRGECGHADCVGVQSLRGRALGDGRCVRRHGEHHFDDQFGDGVLVVLTTAHLCDDKRCRNETHVLALCQRCHLHLDRHHHARNASRTRDAKNGQERLPL
jgi:hypothetical protein